MSYQGYHPSASPLTAAQMQAGDQRFARLDGSNVAAGLFKNGLINGSFDHWQRGPSLGPGVYGSMTYGADRWALVSNVATSSISMVRGTVLIAGGPSLLGSESRYYNRVTYSGSTGAASEIAQFRQNMEGVQRYAGKRVSIRGLARQVGGVDTNISLLLNQNFGSGGSASIGTPAGKIALTAVMKPFSVVVDVPSIAGKVIGTNDTLDVIFILSAGSNYNAVSSNLGTQNVTVDFADVEIREVVPGYSDQVGPYERVPPDIELLRCQRFYQLTGQTIYRILNSGNFQGGIYSIRFPVEMRATPSTAFIGISGSMYNGGSPRPAVASDLTFGAGDTRGVALVFAQSGTAGDYVNTLIAFNAEL